MEIKNKKIVAGMMAGFCVLSTQSVLENFSKLPMRGGNGLISYAMVNNDDDDGDDIRILNDYNNDGRGEYLLEDNNEATFAMVNNDDDDDDDDDDGDYIRILNDYNNDGRGEYLLEDNNEATLIGVFNRDMINFRIPNYVKKGEQYYPVTKINANDGVFPSYLNLKTIYIPSTVRYIYSKDNYFKCEYLKEIYVDPGNQNYMSIDGDLYSKDGTSILRYANCKQSKFYRMPPSVKNVCNGAFYNACYLEQIELSSSLETIGDDAFNGCKKLININIPDNVTKVGEGAFGNLSSLEKISMPYGVTVIPDLLFVNCYSLSEIRLSAATTSIGKQAFDHCFALTEMFLPLSLVSIGNYAFSDCYSLGQVHIYQGQVGIGFDVFHKCVNLASINIPTGAPCKSRLIAMGLRDKIVELNDMVNIHIDNN